MVSSQPDSKEEEKFEKTQLTNFSINDLKGSIPKFMINAGASTHSQIFVNFQKKMDEMKKAGTLSK